MVIGTYILIVTVNEDGLNAPSKTQTIWMDAKVRPVYMLPIRDPLQN